jgi:tRNA (guanine37-N1)-methyltransferase
LANDRKEIAEKILKLSKKKKINILVMFSGVAPYPIVLSKIVRNSKILAVELGKSCCRYAKENVLLNKLTNVEIIQGDVKRIIPKLVGKKFDFIIMARPNLSESFIKYALNVSKKGTIIFYHGFWKESEKDRKIKDLENEVLSYKRKIKILNVKEIGDIAPYEHRYRLEMKVL